jgi:hypothetical protein
VDPASGDIRQGSIDLGIERATFLVGPAFFSVQRFQGATDHVLGIGEAAGG